MKRLILTALPLILLSTVAVSSVQAQTAPETPPANADLISMPITPFHLVSRAYQGAYEQEGIPKYTQLLSQYQLQNITAEDLVRAGIQRNHLPSSALSDRDYISAVDTQLQFLTRSE